MLRTGLPAPGGWMAVLTLAVAAAAPAPANGDDPVQRARAYLESAELGGSSVTGAGIVDASEAATALEASPALEVLRLGLSFSVPDNHEAALARAGALAGTPFADPVGSATELGALLAGDAGLARGGAASDPLVLATALRACERLPCAPDAVSAVVWQLATCQHPDGSFSFADNDGDVAVTAEVARALQGPLASTAAQPLATAAIGWLRPRLAIAALPAADLSLALIAVADADPGLAGSIAAELRARQEPSGGFDGGDVRATALAAQALRRGLPDLAVAMAPLQQEAVTGGPAAAKVYVTNQGRTPAPATVLQATVRDGSGALLGTTTVSVPAIAPGVTTTVLVDLGSQGAPGSRVATFAVNPTQAFAEGDFSNNALAWPYTVKDLPDLVIEPVDIALSPSPAVLYAASRVTVRVRNVGGAAASHVHVQVFDGDPAAGGTLLGESFFDAVLPGAPRVLAASWVPRDTAPHVFYARVDPEGAVREQTRDNNQATATFTAKNPADFVVDLHPNLYVPATTVAQGDPVVLTFSVGGLIQRFGTPYPDPSQWPFHSVKLVVYQGTPGVLGVPVWQSMVGLQTCPNNTPWLVCDVSYPYGYQYKFNTNAATGAVQFTVVVDPDQLTGDVNPADNVIAQTVQVKSSGLAELWVDLASVRSDPPNVPTTGTAIVHATVGNSGALQANDVRVDLVMPARTSSVVLPTLAVGQTADVQFAVSASDLTLGNNGTIVVDPLNAIAEDSKNNNTAPVSLSSGDANFTVSVASTPNPTSTGRATTGRGPRVPLPALHQGSDAHRRSSSPAPPSRARWSRSMRTGSRSARCRRTGSGRCQGSRSRTAYRPSRPPRRAAASAGRSRSRSRWRGTRSTWRWPPRPTPPWEAS